MGDISMRFPPFAVITALLLLGGSAGPLRASIVVADSVNETRSPDTENFGIAAVGWLYTPSISYDLVGIETKFLSADVRIVTVEVYDEHPFFNGGTLLRSADFAPLTNVFSGAFFSSLSLVAGEDYFVGFRNVQALGVNYALDDPPTQMLPAWIDRDIDGLYDEAAPQLDIRSPILRFYTQTAAVPSPSSLTVFGLLIISAAPHLMRRSR
jgi:hypothetical protein